MGRQCGFKFYKYVDGSLVGAPVITVDYGNGPEKKCYTCIYGRCEATGIFLDAVCSNGPYSNDWKNDLKPEEKYTPHLLLNHPELDGFEVHKEKDDPYYNYYGDWYSKYFYYGLENFKKLFDFDEAQKRHDNNIQRMKNEVVEYKNEIESMRKHQENATTKVAFDSFEEKIKEIKEIIRETSNCIADLQEDDYDYDHYMCIKRDIEIVERLITNDPELIVVAFASD